LQLDADYDHALSCSGPDDDQHKHFRKGFWLETLPQCLSCPFRPSQSTRQSCGIASERIRRCPPAASVTFMTWICLGTRLRFPRSQATHRHGHESVIELRTSRSSGISIGIERVSEPTEANRRIAMEEDSATRTAKQGAKVAKRGMAERTHQ